MQMFGLSLQTIFALIWTGWIILFIVFEAAALLLARKMNDNNEETKYDGGTLSEYTWRLVKRNALIFLIFSAFLLWLNLHLLLEV